MEFLFLCLTIFGFIWNAESQNFPQQSQVVNSDYIYYAKEDFMKSLNRRIKTPNLDLQPPLNKFDVEPLSINKESVRPNINLMNEYQNVPNVAQRQSEEDLNNNQAAKKIEFDQAAEAITNFSLNIMKNVIEQKSNNIVVSPYSISALLSLLQQGATDQALQQISIALQMTPQTSAAVYKANNVDYQSRNSRNILRTANNIFLSEGFNINPKFSAIAQTHFGSDVTHTSFANTGKSAALINGWIAYKTNNKIDKLITPEALSVNTQMVLVNAMYFKGLWEIPFRPQSTKPDNFFTSNGTKTVPFMSTVRTFRAGMDKEMGSKIVILPFEREEYSMMIIVPSTLVSIQDTFRSLTVSKLESYLNLGPLEVQLKLPKFSIRADTDLSLVLKKMGISKIFEQRSDLSGLGTYRTAPPQVSSAVHSAVLSIDEEGGSAAAATAFTVVALSNDSPSLVMKVDRPFIAILWDVKTKVPLFMAKIEDPS